MSSGCYIKKLREKVFFFTANAVKVIAYSRNSTWRHPDRVTPGTSDRIFSQPYVPRSYAI